MCEVDRLRRAMERTPGLHTRIFTEAERRYCEKRRDPAERYAARFAAKEAVLKALGVGLGACGLREIEVVVGPSGAPEVVLHGGASRLAEERAVSAWRLSLTHTASLAHATALALTGSA